MSVYVSVHLDLQKSIWSRHPIIAALNKCSRHQHSCSSALKMQNWLIPQIVWWMLNPNSTGFLVSVHSDSVSLCCLSQGLSSSTPAWPSWVFSSFTAACRRPKAGVWRRSRLCSKTSFAPAAPPMQTRGGRSSTSGSKGRTTTYRTTTRPMWTRLSGGDLPLCVSVTLRLLKHNRGYGVSNVSSFLLFYSELTIHHFPSLSGWESEVKSEFTRNSVNSGITNQWQCIQQR